jgi:RNA polymerase sigma-70 factor (ECF subfamily)
MPETPVSLLERLRVRPDPASWQRLIDLYEPLIRNWLRSHALQAPDADDVTQEVLQTVARELPHFHHDLRRGAFRRWLRTITVNRLRMFWRDRRRQPLTVGGNPLEYVLEQLEEPGSPLSQQWDEEHDQHVLRRLLALLEPEFAPTTWLAFRGLLLEGQSTTEVAARLGITPNAVRIAKSRVLSRLRQEIEGLVD